METLADGRYRLIEEIAKTRISSIYRSFDAVENREVAIKLIRSGGEDERELMGPVSQLRHEAGILAGLKHPHVIPLDHVGISEGRVYLVLPLLEGHSLSEEIREGRGIDCRRAALIAMQVADALSYVHAKGVLHLDIKPGNLFILKGGVPGECRVVLLDFGISRLTSVILRERPGEMVGTAAYMSPEQTGILGQPVDQRSDLYSLGITLYQMVTGCLPLVARDLPTLLHKQIAEEPLPPSRVVQSTPRSLEDIIVKLLRKDPGERYLTAGGLREDLAHFIKLADRGREDQPFALESGERRGVLNLDPPIRGRLGETAAFEEALGGLPVGGGGVIFVKGEAGAGKTRLCQEYLKLGLKRHMLLLAAQASMVLKEQPCQLLLDMLAAFAETLNSYPGELQATLLEGLQRRGGDYKDFKEVVSELLRAWRELSEIPHVDPKSLQQDIFSRLYLFLKAIARESDGIIICIDDLHWADDGSLCFFNYLAYQAASDPILFIASLDTGQVGPRSELANMIAGFELNHPSFLDQELKSLDFSAGRHVLADVLRAPPAEIPAEVSQHVFNVTAGNPLFLIEYVRGAVEAGVLVCSDEGWRLDEGRRAVAAMPRTLAEIMAGRLGRMEPAALDALRYASILGLTFKLDSIEHLSGKGTEELISLLDEAREAQLIRERGTIGGGGYMFAHQQILDAVYRSMDPETRRRLHEKAGTVLEERGSLVLDRVAFELSKHFYLGYSHEKAFRYSLLSASLARSRCSFREVVLYLERALTLFPSYESKELTKLWLDIHIRLGETCYRLSMYDKAIACFQEAIRYSRDRKQTAIMRSYIGSILYRKGQFRDALRYHEQALLEYGLTIPKSRPALFVKVARQLALLELRALLPASLRRTSSPKEDSTLPERIRLYSQTSYNCFFLGELLRSLWANLEQLYLAETVGESEQLAQACNLHGLLCSQMGLFRRAEKFIERSRKINEKLVSRAWGIAQCKSYLGYCLMNQGRSREAVSRLVEAVESWRSVGDPLELGYALRYLAWSYVFIGDIRKAATTFSELVIFAGKTEDRRGEADARNGKAWVSVMMGEFSESIECCRQALAISTSPELLNPRAIAHQIMGRAYHCLDDLQRAEMELEESRILIEKHRLVATMHSLTYAWLAEVYLSDKAKLDSLSARDRKAELGGIYSLCIQGIRQAGRIKRCRAENLRSMALCYAELGRDAKANSCFNRAESILQTQGYRYELGRTYRFHGEFLLTRNRRLAVDHLERALNIFTDIAAPREIEITRELLGEDRREAARKAVERPPERAVAALADASAFESLLELYRQVTSVLDLDKLLVRVVDLANQVVGAERGFIVLKERGGLSIKVARDFARKSIGPDDHEVSWGIIKKVVRDRRPLLIADAQDQKGLQEKDSIQAYGLRSVACVPITSGRKFLGVIYVDNRFARGLFTGRDLRLLNLFASQAAVALENAVRYGEVKEAERKVSEENRYLKRDFALQHRFSNLVAEDPQVQMVLEEVEQVAPTEVTVLIQGETGTGKGLIARALHARSLRAEAIFIEQNCATLPESLLESELFGHKKGAFTGAVKDKKGLMEVADGATLFLDEIAETAPAIQAKLLRVIEGQAFRRLGDTAERKVNVRIIAATNRDLAEEVEAGRFRADLYYRLSAVKIRLPLLRERKDKQALANYLLHRFAAEAKKEIKGITPEAMSVIERYPWPGNVRELENEIQRAVMVTESGAPIRVDALSPEVRRKAAPGRGEVVAGARPDLNLPLKEAVSSFEKKFIEGVLRECEGNMTRAAERLGMSRYGLYKKIQKLMPDRVST